LAVVIFRHCVYLIADRYSATKERNGEEPLSFEETIGQEYTLLNDKNIARDETLRVHRLLILGEFLYLFLGDVRHFYLFI